MDAYVVFTSELEIPRNIPGGRTAQVGKRAKESIGRCARTYSTARGLIQLEQSWTVGKCSHFLYFSVLLTRENQGFALLPLNLRITQLSSYHWLSSSHRFWLVVPRNRWFDSGFSEFPDMVSCYPSLQLSKNVPSRVLSSVYSVKCESRFCCKGSLQMELRSHQLTLK